MSDLTPRFKVKDASAKLVYDIDWGTNWLAAGVTITSTWTITGPDSVLTKDSETVLAGNRITRLRLLAGTPGARYKITNHVITNETPAQEDERSFELLIEDR